MHMHICFHRNYQYVLYMYLESTYMFIYIFLGPNTHEKTRAKAKGYSAKGIGVLVVAAFLYQPDKSLLLSLWRSIYVPDKHVLENLP